MSIVTPGQFLGELDIANVDTVPVQERVQWFIDEYEPQLLTELLGETLYAELLAGLILVPVIPATDPVTYDPIPAKWLALKAKVTPAILKFVWYWYINNQITTVTGTGTKKAENDNAGNASSWDIMVLQWNKMVKNNHGIHKFCKDNATDYPDFKWNYDDYVPFYVNGWFDYNLIFGFLRCEIPAIYRYKNTLGI